MPTKKTTHESDTYEGDLPEGIDLNLGQPDGVTVEREIHRVDENGARTLIVPAGVPVNPEYLKAMGISGKKAKPEADTAETGSKAAQPATENKGGDPARKKQ